MDAPKSKNTPLLSICVPSYNRPEQLGRLLATVDCRAARVEIVICEDAAPRREEVRKVVEEFRAKSPYQVIYEENASNLGYDGNLRRLIEIASGVFVLFMGDDDWFPADVLDKYLDFLEQNPDVGYVLRSYLMEHPGGICEPHRYLGGRRRFDPGVKTCAWLYKRSVVICGVTFKRESARKYATNRFDGTLLYQLYLVLEIGLREPSVYCDLPVAIAASSYRGDRPQFGAAPAERGRFEVGVVSPENSINFTKGFFEISQAFDQEHGLRCTELIREDLSRYSYPFLSIQRKRGFWRFLAYAVRLARETELDATWHYPIYTLALLVLGERVCDRMILLMRRCVGHTPNL